LAAQPSYGATAANGAVVLYEGPVLVNGELEPELPARVEQSIDPPDLRARFWGETSAAAGVRLFDARDSSIALPPDVDLTPPATTEEKHHEAGTSWIDSSVHILRLRAGDLSRAAQVAFHVSGALETLPVRAKSDRRYAPQAFELCGWRLRLHPTGNQVDGDPFVAVIEGEPPAGGPTQESVDFLREHLFGLLGLLTNREIGIGPTCGLRGDEVVWVEWGAPRMRSGRPGIRWAPGHIAGAALPSLALGLSELASDLAFDAIVDRAINFLMAADGGEVVDVRLPIAWSGLELLAWAVLQRENLRSRVRRDYQDGRLDPDDWQEHRQELTAELEAAGAEAERLREQEAAVENWAELSDVEQATFERLSELRGRG
jgi:hypothetical protein